MAVTLVQGAQWGDEGKGKIIDYLSKDSNFVVRYNGGNNAGHTVINKYGKFGMHLVPSGIFTKKATSVISNGVVLDLEVLTSEIEALKKAGIKVDKSRLIISPRCHIIMPYHKILDGILDEIKGKGKTGTTKRGIGPCYADKVTYNGIRLADVFDKKVFSEKLRVQLLVKNKILKALGEKPLSFKKVEYETLKLFKEIKSYVREPLPFIEDAIQKNKKVLLEGAHGVLLDTDWGTYPFATASTTLSGGVTAGVGISPFKITRIVGVVKAYTTRVGAGPLPTEQSNGIGAKLQSEGLEVGTTSGRKRRCGWLDLEIIKFAAKINGFSEIAVTKLDVLDTFPTIKICTHYMLNGKKVRYQDGDAVFLSKVKPVYKTLKGWMQPTKGIKTYKNLPSDAKIYIKEMEKHIGIKVSFVSTGRKTNDIITL